MGKLLIAKSGSVENPVPHTQELTIDVLKSIVGSYRLRYLGPPALELPALGQPGKLDEYRDPDSVVILISKTESSSLKCDKAGFYLVEGLKPSEFKL